MFQRLGPERRAPGKRPRAHAWELGSAAANPGTPTHCARQNIARGNAPHKGNACAIGRSASAGLWFIPGGGWESPPHVFFRGPPSLRPCLLHRLQRYSKRWACQLRRPDCRWRPYRVECTGSLPTSEVKRRRARLVLGWGTAREDLRVLPAFALHTSNKATGPARTHARAHTHTHTVTHTHAQTHAHGATHNGTHTHTHTLARTHTHAHTHTHRLTRTRTQAQTHAQRHRHTMTQKQRHTRPHAPARKRGPASEGGAWHSAGKAS